MKARILVFVFFIAAAGSAHAGSMSYAQCGTYDAYLLIYRTTDKFDELGKLRCNEKVEVLGHAEGGYSQIRTLDGRVGWVHDVDLSETPPAPQRNLTFGLTERPQDARPSPSPFHSSPFLTNVDIVTMYKQHQGPDVILKRIRSNRSSFDTSPEALLLLRASGLGDNIILAMLEAPVASETPHQRAPETVDVRIPDGTTLELELNRDVSWESVHDGMIVEMSVAKDLVVNGVLVIARGAEARARVLAVKQPGAHGSGEVAWFMQDVVAAGGDHIPVTFASKQLGNNRTRNFEGYPFFSSEFHKGSPAIKASDKHFRAVIHGDTVLSVPQSFTADEQAPKPKSQSVQVSPHPVVQPVAAPQPPADEAKP